MLTARRRRALSAVGASFIAHIAVLTILAVQRPILIIPVEQAGPPEPIIPILLMPRTPPAAAPGGPPSEIHLHRRPQRFMPDQPPVAPLVAPATPTAPTETKSGPVTVNPPSPAAELQKGEVRNALQGLVGCANPDLAGLTRAQRAKCDERLAAGAKEAPFIEPGATLSREKRGLLDKAAAGREADRRYRDGVAAPGVTQSMGGAGDPGKPRGLPN